MILLKDRVVFFEVGQTTFAEAEAELLKRTLYFTNLNRVEAARILQCDPKTISNKIEAYGLLKFASFDKSPSPKKVKPAKTAEPTTGN